MTPQVSSPYRKKPIGHRFSLFRTLLLGIVVISLIATPTGAQETPISEPLTEAQALHLAGDHPGFEAYWAAFQANADAETRIAQALPNPDFRWTREQLFSDPTETEDTLTIEQRLLTSGQRRLNVEAARADALATGEEIRVERASHRHQVRISFFELLYRQEVITAYRNAAVDLERAIESYRQRVEAGESSRYELERLRLERAEYEAITGEETAAIYQIRGELAAHLGDDGLSDETLSVQGELLPREIPDDDAIREALAVHPELIASDHRIDSQTLRSQAARRIWIPDLLIHAGLKRGRGGGERHLGWEAGVAVALPIFYRGDGEVSQADARHDAEVAWRGLLEDRAATRAMAQARSARRYLAITDEYEVEGLERARHLFALAEQSYLAGEMSLLEFIDAHSGLIAAELRYLELAATTRAELINLQKLLETGDTFEGE